MNVAVSRTVLVLFHRVLKTNKQGSFMPAELKGVAPDDVSPQAGHDDEVLQLWVSRLTPSSESSCCDVTVVLRKLESCVHFVSYVLFS